MQNSQLRKTAARTADALEAEIATVLRTHMKNDHGASFGGEALGGRLNRLSRLI
jgi:hypothetical protein